MKTGFSLGWVLFGLVISWMVYTWLNDDTRVTHPNYRNSSTYHACITAANMIYRSSLDKALADPSIWRLSGHKNAQDYANMSYSIARSGCEP